VISVSGIVTDPASGDSSFTCCYSDEFRDFQNFKGWLSQAGWHYCNDGKEKNPVSVSIKDIGDGRALVAGHSVSIRYLHSELGTWGSSLAPRGEDSRSAMTIWVENASAAGVLPCNCKNWLQHWERFKNRKAGRCAAEGCVKTDVDGACVKRIPDHECYVVPLCSLHRNSVGYFPVRSDLLVASATKQNTCVEKMSDEPQTTSVRSART